MRERVFYNPERDRLIIVDCHPHKKIYYLYIESETVVSSLGACIYPKFLYEPCYYVGDL